jgi:hypothetical protein
MSGFTPANMRRRFPCLLTTRFAEKLTKRERGEFADLQRI